VGAELDEPEQCAENQVLWRQAAAGVRQEGGPRRPAEAGAAIGVRPRAAGGGRSCRSDWGRGAAAGLWGPRGRHVYAARFRHHLRGGQDDQLRERPAAARVGGGGEPLRGALRLALRAVQVRRHCISKLRQGPDGTGGGGGAEDGPQGCPPGPLPWRADAHELSLEEATCLEGKARRGLRAHVRAIRRRREVNQIHSDRR